MCIHSGPWDLTVFLSVALKSPSSDDSTSHRRASLALRHCIRVISFYSYFRRYFFIPNITFAISDYYLTTSLGNAWRILASPIALI
jgi:hypothetical protein